MIEITFKHPNNPKPFKFQMAQVPRVDEMIVADGDEMRITVVRYIVKDELCVAIECEVL